MKQRLISTTQQLLKNKLVRYIIVGGSTVVVELSIFTVLLSVLKLESVPAHVISLTLAAGYNFVLSNFWTFQAGKSKQLRKVSKFTLLVLVNYVLNNILFYIINVQLGVNPYFSKITVILLQTSWTFLIYKYWVFKT